MTSNITGYQIPLIIDIGSDKVKFSQADLMLSNIYKNAKEEEMTPIETVDDNTNEDNLSNQD